MRRLLAIPKTVMAGLDPAIYVCRATAVFVVLLVSGCASQSGDICHVAFPSAFGDAGQGYARRLQNMGEPSLSCGRKAETEAYRLLWIPSFSNIVAVRISREMQEYRLDATVLSRDGDESRIVGKSSRLLTSDEWREFKTVLTESGFWDMPATLDGMPSTDGWRWVVEGQNDTRYHAIDRQVSRGASYEKLGLLFLQYAGIPARGR